MEKKTDWKIGDTVWFNVYKDRYSNGIIIDIFDKNRSAAKTPQQYVDIKRADGQGTIVKYITAIYETKEAAEQSQ